METKKAIMTLENAKSFNFMGRPKVCEAIDIALEALEKQIPKKPEYVDEYMDDSYCPCCGQYEFEFGTTTWTINFCPNCGQAIDWSEE